MQLNKRKLAHRTNVQELIDIAKILKSEDNTNPEYDRALFELIAWIVPCNPPVDLEDIAKSIQDRIEGKE